MMSLLNLEILKTQHILWDICDWSIYSNVLHMIGQSKMNTRWLDKRTLYRMLLNVSVSSKISNKHRISIVSMWRHIMNKFSISYNDMDYFVYEQFLFFYLEFSTFHKHLYNKHIQYKIYFFVKKTTSGLQR
jgi:hypothetical protein